jgi:catechol 2,3-dioxygenase-like lactoylglutathione lyase family enzyme
MESKVPTGRVHHVKLTVTDVARARDFYTGLLGFTVAAEFGQATLISNGEVIIGLSPAPDPARAVPGDRFDENRVGLDHLSFSVPSRDDLERASRLFDERGVEHGEIIDLGAAFGLYVLMFRDPDHFQLELSAPYA